MNSGVVLALAATAILAIPAGAQTPFTRRQPVQVCESAVQHQAADLAVIQNCQANVAGRIRHAGYAGVVFLQTNVPPDNGSVCGLVQAHDPDRFHTFDYFCRTSSETGAVVSSELKMK